MDASQGTATQLPSLARGDAEDLGPPRISPTANALDDGLKPGTGTMPQGPRAANPPRASGQHVSCLVALIADTPLEEVKPCKAMDVAMFLDSERLSMVGRRMRAAGQDNSPILGHHSPESDSLSPHLAQYAKRTRELLQLVDFTLGVPSFSLSS